MIQLTAYIKITNHFYFYITHISTQERAISQLLKFLTKNLTMKQRTSNPNCPSQCIECELFFMFYFLFFNMSLVRNLSLMTRLMFQLKLNTF